jgi:glycerol kinase
VHRATGLFVTAHYGASKFRWCLEHVPAVATARDRGTLVMGPMASYLAWCLAGRSALVADPVNASRTLLWNLRTRDWDDELLLAFGLERAWFPRCVDTRHAYGPIELDGCDVPLTIVTGDQSAAMFAFGPVQPDTAYINIGTGAFVSRPAGHYPKFARRLLTSIVHAEDREPSYVLEGTVNGAGSALEWAQKELKVDNLFDRLPAWLDAVVEPPLFLNGISGLGAPFWVPDFPSQFVGDGDAAARMVAVVESFVFLLHNNMSEMLKFASPPEQVQVTGGLAELDGVCQRIADLSGLPVYRPVEHEATARGAAWLVAAGPDDWPETDIGTWFRPRRNEALRQRFNRWLDALLQAMRAAANC